ncbi:MupA/Atu3671 family FMN-dependent luciferase-like monooxygenase [uncultured Sulfitobacter sp.]|uniref:MupA/Atu3671 family FMN-dependent luciferase-like monooxygenase n=1 Tax=uncultured Sulfitobacter sp. TaxID=191468 RepID=UPI0026088F45|nr:MupA/Atu3671 family FMN-dependent luciferase-like monooxygenase [uncultured Sulfitobacter sp.]
MTAPFNPAAFSVLLMGQESLTIACGDMLLAGGHSIAAVISDDATVQGWAEGQGLSVYETPKALVAAGAQADWFLSIANLAMVPDAALALAGKGAVNFHDGPLPQMAGLNTPAWAILRGHPTHGISWHMMEGGVDEGDLIATRTIEIAQDETAFSLNSKCYAAGMESFADVLAQLERGTVERRPQDLNQRSYFARDDRPERGGFLDFSARADVVSATVRGLDFGDYWNPLTTAKLTVGEQVLRVGGITAAEGALNAGQVGEVAADRVTIGTGSTPVRLSRVTGLDGLPVDLSEVFTSGMLLSSAGLEMPRAGEEPRWRKMLRSADPVPCPLMSSGDEAGQIPLESAPAAQDRAVALVALTVLQAAGMDEGRIALAHEGAGFTAPWVPLRVEATADKAVAAVCAAIAGQLTKAAESTGFALDLMVRDPEIDNAAPDVAISLTDAPLGGAALTVCLTDQGAVLHHDSRMDAASAGLIAARLNAAFAADAQTCGALWAVPENEAALMAGWNGTARDYDRTTIHAAFEAKVAATPDAEALVCEGDSLTYAALNARANQLAHVLRGKGVTAGTPVGLYTARGIDLLIGTLGILKAGGAYVPLDPAYPADRIAHYISDSTAPVIVTQRALVGGLPVHQAQVVALGSADQSGAPDSNPDPVSGPDDLAYLIYTSGSTGTPKGVMVSHGNVANFFGGMDDRIDHKTGDVWLAVTSLSFDISVLELFWTLSRGFKLVLAGDESRTLVSNGPIVDSGKHMDFNLFYWGNDDGVGPKKYELLLEGAKFADAHGFNAVWTPERHFHAFGGPYPNPSVTGAAVAAVTKNLAVRAGSCVAPLHHPARIAEEWAVIDNLTNGRVGLAIASGWQPDDFVLRPENTPPHNKPAMYVAIDQLRALWRGETVEFPRADGEMHGVVTQPRPVSKELPVWVTTAGNPQTWKEAGEIGANVLTHLLGQSIDEVADKIKIYRQALRDAGHNPSDFTVTLMLHSYLADTRAEAEEVARGPMKDYLNAAAALIKQYAWAFPAFKRPEGTTNAFDLDLEGLSQEELDAILEFAFQRYFNDSGLFGTVADGVARVEQLKRIGVDEVACLIDYGIEPSVVLEGLKPLAEVLALTNKAGGLAENDHSLAAQIIRHGVTHLQCTPSMAQMLVANDEARMALGRVKHLMVGGEALPGALVDALRACLGGDIQNMYGPTETTIWSTTHKVQGDAGNTAPIGTAIANTQVYVLDAKKAVQPIGVAGELWIGGDGVTQGYWQRPEMTAERFIDNPFGPGKLYGTGDMVAFDAQGCLHFQGRADAQVKIRGHRIELGEIEARLASLPQVREAVVIARDAPGGAQLVGYVTTSAAVAEADAKAALAADLPEIMVPSAIVMLDAMPLTPNKKIDRKALPAPTVRAAARSEDAAPASGTQAVIAQVWSGLLGVGDIRGEDNFFALGGHSLLAVQAHRDIRTALGTDSLSITDIFRFPTLAGLAGHLDKGTGAPPPPAPEAAPDPAKSETMSKRRMMRRSRTGA